MKKLVTGIILLLIGAQSHANKGDLAVLGFSTLYYCPIVLLTTTDIPGNATYTITDKGWGNNAFSGGEGNLFWTAPASGVPKNTVFTIASNTTSGFSGGGGNATIGTVAVSGNMNTFATYENLYIYEGNVPPVNGTDPKWVWAVTLSSWTPGAAASLTSYDLPSALAGYSWASGQSGAYEMYYTGTGNYAASVFISDTGAAVFTALTNNSLFYKGNSPSTGVTVPLYNVAPLPLSLLSFTATATNTLVACKWQTTDERNVAYMQIERSSDGRTFETTATIPARNSAGNHEYEAIDQTPQSGRSYYRLATMNGDGSVQYSKAVAVSVNRLGRMSLQVIPNPVQRTFVLRHPIASAGARLVIRGLDGRIMAVRRPEP